MKTAESETKSTILVHDVSIDNKIILIIEHYLESQTILGSVYTRYVFRHLYWLL